MRITLFAVRFFSWNRNVNKSVEYFYEFQLAEGNSRMTYRGGGSGGHPPPDFEGRENRIEAERDNLLLFASQDFWAFRRFWLSAPQVKLKFRFSKKAKTFWQNLLKFGFCKKSLRKDATLKSWTLFWPQKVINFSELHLLEVTSYKIHILGENLV